MKWNLLIVDDEDRICAILERLLTLQDDRFDVVTFSHAADALEWIKTNKVHILLSDISMPDMDGLELLEMAKKLDGQIQVVMMTGYTTFHKALSCFEHGANDYILKPFDDLTQVIEVLNHTVGKLERWKKIIHTSRGRGKR